MGKHYSGIDLIELVVRSVDKASIFLFLDLRNIFQIIW